MIIDGPAFAAGMRGEALYAHVNALMGWEDEE